MRLIDADNFIERLNHVPMVQEALRIAMDKMPTIEPERKKGKWIPCSERLPEDDTEVFVYLFDRPSPYIAWVTDSCWFTEEFQVEKENYPKAWMPLPEPYGGDQDDKN